MIIETTLTEEYIPEWGLYESLRELLSNAKDAEVESGHTMKVWRTPANVLCIENEGTMVPRDSLLMGYGTKRDKEELIGVHGEGLLLALLVLARKGMKVTVNNRNEAWTPVIEKSAKFNSNVLKIKVRENNQDCGGFRIKIYNITEETWNKIKDLFLFLDYPADAIQTTRGNLLKDEKYKHKVYVKGVFVHTDGDLCYGFDLKQVKIDRDRKMINKWDQRWEMAHIMKEAATKTPGMLREVYDLIEEGAEEVHSIGYALDGTDRQGMVSEFQSRYGEDAVPVVNIEQSRDIENLGRRGVVVTSTMAEVLEKELGSFDSIKDTLARDKFTMVSYRDLTEKEQGNLEGAIELIQEVDKGISLNMIDVVEFAAENMQGQYVDGRIRIAKKELEEPVDTLRCIAHEFAHHSTQHDHLDKSFSDKIEILLASIAVKLMQRHNNSLILGKV